MGLRWAGGAPRAVVTSEMWPQPEQGALLVARLNPAEWRSVRTMWEASANPGLIWLTRAGGGPWNVSAEALRRRIREGWRKHRPPQGGTEADVGCWSADPDAHRVCGSSRPIFALPHTPEMDPDDLRDAMLDRHRADWAAARRLLDDAVRGDHGRSGTAACWPRR